MIQRYSFIVLFLTLLSSLTWWAGQIEPAISALADVSLPSSAVTQPLRPTEEAQRRELVEALDRLVAYEHYYHSVYGHFTKLVSRLGYSIPSSLDKLFDIRVTEASHERLQITAISEIEGQTRDLVSIDQDYSLRASFALPAPRAEYLRVLALKQLRALRSAPLGQGVEEQGVFRGYFRYELKHDFQDRKVAFAVGVRPPVVGVQLELGVGGSELSSSPNLGGGTGQVPMGNVMTTMEEAYLAQHIFKGEVGRYAKNWSELSKVAAFDFEDKDLYGSAGQVPFGNVTGAQEIDVEYASQESGRQPSSDPEPIEIEAL